MTKLGRPKRKPGEAWVSRWGKKEKAMTKFEEEMYFGIHGFLPTKEHQAENMQFKDVLEKEAKAAAEVAKRYIEKAFNDAKQMEPYLSTAERYPNLNEWLKENGIV